MSSKRAIRRRSCGRKVRHATSQAASQAIKGLVARKGYQGRLNVYLCRFCGAYHIGHGGSR